MWSNQDTVTSYLLSLIQTSFSIHAQIRENESTYPTGWIYGLDELMYVEISEFGTKVAQKILPITNNISVTTEFGKYSTLLKF